MVSRKKRPKRSSSNGSVSPRDLPSELVDGSFKQLVEDYFKSYLEREQIKPSTKRLYESELAIHILPALGAKRVFDIGPLDIEKLVQSRLKGGASPKTARNMVGLLQSIFLLAVDNDLIPRSPVRKRHRPRVVRSEKPVWTAEQLKTIVDSVPQTHRNLFQCAMLTGARLGELLGFNGGTSTSMSRP